MVHKLIKLQERISLEKGKLLLLEEDWNKLKTNFVETTNQMKDQVMKGQSFDSLLYKPIKKVFEEKESVYKSKKVDIERSIEGLRKEMNVIYKSSKDLSKLKNYGQIVPIKDFIEKVESLNKGVQDQTIDKETFDSVCKCLLQFVDVEVDGELFKAYTDKTYYSDLILLNEDNEILFVKRSKDDDFEPGKLALPGGHIEPAEEAEVACRREVFEEIGLDLRDKNLVPCGKYIDKDIVINYFVTKVKAEDVVLILDSRELIQYEWVKLNEVVDKDLLLNLKDNFEKVITLPITLIS